MTFDFFSERANLCLVKKLLVIAIRLERALGDFPRMHISSAKNTADTVIPLRSRPWAVLFNSWPRSEMKILNSRGDRLQPAILYYSSIAHIRGQNYKERDNDGLNKLAS